MNTYRITYTIAHDEHEYTDEIVTADEDMSFIIASNKVSDFWLETGKAKLRFTNALLNEGYAILPNDGRVIKDIDWQTVPPITVTVRGGVVQDIDQIPKGFQVKVIDWDNDELDDKGNPVPLVGFWDRRDNSPADHDWEN